jgi:hypothetical protein
VLKLGRQALRSRGWRTRNKVKHPDLISVNQR